MNGLLIKRRPLGKLFSDRSGVVQMLFLSAAFSIGMCFFRVLYSGEPLFLSLIWNLFLAFVPYAITRYCRHAVQWIESTPRFIIVFFAWLFFLPNSFYIITDLFHLKERPYIPLWFDLALIFSFAWNGLLLGVLSVRQMEKLLYVKWHFKNEVLFIVPLMLLNGVGIYLGRYLRYNSWDVVSNPFGLAGDVVSLVAHPVRNRFDWSMIICFSILVSLIYLSLKRMARDQKEL